MPRAAWARLWRRGHEAARAAPGAAEAVGEVGGTRRVRSQRGRGAAAQLDGGIENKASRRLPSGSHLRIWEEASRV